MITLDDYLDSASRQRWAWGRMDCVQFGLGWVSARVGRPLALPLAYRDAKAAMAFLDAHGGLHGVVAEWMAANGFPPTDAPEDGDVGVVPVIDIDPMNIAGASVVVRRNCWWIAKALRGYVGLSVQGIPAWRIS